MFEPRYSMMVLHATVLFIHSALIAALLIACQGCYRINTAATKVRITNSVSHEPISNVLVDCTWAVTKFNLANRDYSSINEVTMISNANGELTIPAYTQIYYKNLYEVFCHARHPLYEEIRWLHLLRINDELTPGTRWKFDNSDNSSDSFNVKLEPIINSLNNRAPEWDFEHYVKNLSLRLTWLKNDFGMRWDLSPIEHEYLKVIESVADEKQRSELRNRLAVEIDLLRVNEY